MINSFNTPVLFLVFNRPDTTQQVFEAIKKQQPKYLFIAADGPREHIMGEKETCMLIQRELLDSINWDCELKTLFREKNIGCKNAIEAALDWFFTHIDEGIILEDDTLPNNDFFNYCSVLLDRYRDNEKIFSINGCSLGYQNNRYDYGVTNYFNMWGWATWKRSNIKVKKTWQQYQQKPDLLKDSFLKKRLTLHTFWDLSGWYNYWQTQFLATVQGKINTWDYQWVYSVLKTNSFCIRPNQNYVINLGYGNMATHTTNGNHLLSGLKFGQTQYEQKMIKGKMTKDVKYERDYIAEIWNSYNVFERSKFHNFMDKIKNKIKKFKSFIWK